MNQQYLDFNIRKEKCRDCYIGNIYNRVVLSDGNTDNPIVLIIGEAPGNEEVISGKPFVGKAGKLLRATLEANGINTTNSLITNTIPCRPEKNKFPKDKDSIHFVNSCMQKWLRFEIEILKPKYIVLIGNTPTYFLLNLSEGITKIRGKWYSYNNIPAMPCYHPSYVLRKQYMAGGDQIKQDFLSDINVVAKTACILK